MTCCYSHESSRENITPLLQRCHERSQLEEFSQTAQKQSFLRPENILVVHQEPNGWKSGTVERKASRFFVRSSFSVLLAVCTGHVIAVLILPAAASSGKEEREA
jgi:hypothetical protein